MIGGGTRGTLLGRRLRQAALCVAVAIVAATVVGCTEIVGIIDDDLDVLWPRRGAVLDGFETLRVRVPGRDLDDYAVYWYVDGGREHRMWNEWHERPRHKAAVVDTWDWYWNGRGPYRIGFVAVDRRGREIAHETVRVYVE